MSKKIAIIGAGITGMAAAVLLSRNYSIDIFSENLGGNFDNGGLKYIHYHPSIIKLMKELNLNFETKKMVGAIFLGNDTDAFENFELHPEFFWYCLGNKELENYCLTIQNMYKKKVIGDYDSSDVMGDSFNCMNKPWNYEKNVSVIPDYPIINFLKKEIVNNESNYSDFNIIKKRVDIHALLKMVTTYDKIIYTVQPYMLWDYFYKESTEVQSLQEFGESKNVFKFKNVNIIHALLNNRFAEIWWDYCYFPQPSLPFYRIYCKKRSNGYNLSVETTECISSMDSFTDVLDTFLYKNFGNVKIEKFTKSDESVINKLHMEEDAKMVWNELKNKLEYDYGIITLGRYAEWKSKIMFHDVVDRIYNEML